MHEAFTEGLDGIDDVSVGAAPGLPDFSASEPLHPLSAHMRRLKATAFPSLTF